ncbi:MAG TPA: DUF5989 family protein [Candidatus Acidoferrales bacterium]|nr:DUF5989 family protein [Candidatus Acidoferrales bacterium]
MTADTLAALAAVIVTWVLARRLEARALRQLLLLAASYLFYGVWGGWFLAVLIASSVLNFYLGGLIRRRRTAGALWIGIACNLLLLGLFKYLPALAQTAALGASEADLVRRIAMPLGISFWTFQALSYLFDVYRGEELNPSLVEFCLYMAFWPTVLSGPVCRLPQMLPQLREAPGFRHEDVVAGTTRIIQGLIMKFALAEILAVGLAPGEGVVGGFDDVQGGWGALDVWLLAIGFGFQLFFDFAGYSHLVIGTALVFGVRLQENFNRPYLALTPAIFWTRWHMSLSFWIRDYVFLPLATLRRGRAWVYLVLVFAMTLFGLWHAPKATFVLWGCYQGFLLVLHRLGQQAKARLAPGRPAFAGGFLSWAGTFAAISLGWVLFRANDLGQALAMLGALFSPAAYSRLALPHSFYVLVPAVTIGYFAYEAVRAVLARWREEERGRANVPAVRLVAVELCQLLRARAWWWLAPVCFAALAVTLIRLLEQSAAVSPFMYTLF